MNDTRCDDEAADIVNRVIEAIADAEGVSPNDLSPPLYDAIDLEALERLLDSDQGSLEVRFTYGDYEIVVTDDGTVDVQSWE